MPKPIVPAAVRYIKLGVGGGWEDTCLKEGIIRIGFGTGSQTKHPARFKYCLNKQWKKLTNSFAADYPDKALRFTNELLHFFEDDGSTLWITFHDGLLHWAFLDRNFTPKQHPDGDGVFRTVKGKWNSNDLTGNPLQQSALPEKLTRLAKYKGTSCTPSAAEEALQHINCNKEAFPATPKAIDLAKPPARVKSTTYRVIRDTKLAKQVKALHNYECQLCRKTIVLPDGSRYAEAHHIRPLGKPHNGLDRMDNIMCVCPNHHAELDYGASLLSVKNIQKTQGHYINEEYVFYHNKVICTEAAKVSS
jgi:5-methylcytosine-specific restriction endonuclease McrA